MVADPSSKVCGVLWRLDQAHLSTLDEQESVHKGLYKRFGVTVHLLDPVARDGKPTGETVEAITYQVMLTNIKP